MKWLTPILFLLFLTPIIYADSNGTCTIIISGPYSVLLRAISTEGGPIADAAIRISNGTWSHLEMTNTTGYITTLTLAPGTYSVIADKGGFDTYLASLIANTGTYSLTLTPTIDVSYLLLGLLIGAAIIILVLATRR